ncbi:multidrug resistance-associated 5-like [Paramuricea clavata]|uniref:Multidrug resistance-associated 5-like n=1 Tax=Paramuricea clavata TaxID=317549 RepID=A0A6S7HDJ5_PARCT|nr:multidrug resistance-associated 5-like [Paramuricea clavata]
MYNPGFEDELYKDRNQSFRKAVRAPKKNQRYLADKSDLYDPQDTSTASDVGYTTTWWTKYSWKRFLPWAPRAKGHPVKHPLDDSGFISFIFLSWATPMIMKGFKKPLETCDLGKLSRSDSAAVNYRRFERFWAEEVKKKGIKDASIGRVIYRTVRTKVIVSALLYVLMLLIMFVGPAFIINRMIKFVEMRTDSIGKGIALVVGLMVSEVSRSWFQSISFMINLRNGLNARSMAWMMVYNKMARLKNAGDKSIGELVNICASDAQRVFDCFFYGFFVIGGPFALILVIAYTTYILGPSALLGCVILFFMFPIQAFIGKIIGKLRTKAVVVTDRRVKLMNEVLSCIKLIKMYAWEKSFAKVIGEYLESLRSTQELYYLEIDEKVQFCMTVCA